MLKFKVFADAQSVFDEGSHREFPYCL